MTTIKYSNSNVPEVSPLGDGQYAHTLHGVCVITLGDHNYSYTELIEHLLAYSLAEKGDTVTITNEVHYEPTEPLLKPGDFAYGQSVYTVEGDNLKPTDITLYSQYHY